MAAFPLACVLIGIYVTHRIVGPQVAIRRLISELKKGHYGKQIQLRRNDYLKNIASELNELSTQLKQTQTSEPSHQEHSILKESA